MIIAFAGMPGSGKTVASKQAEKLGFKVLRLGDLTDEELKRRGLKRNEKNERLVREDLRRKLGMEVYAKKVSEKIDKLKLREAVLDGVRSYEEYLYLKNRYGDKFKVIAILASAKARYKRLGKRKVRPLTIQECKSRDRAEIEKLNHAGTIAMADYFIINEGTKKEFKEDVINLINKKIRKVYKSKKIKRSRG